LYYNVREHSKTKHVHGTSTSTTSSYANKSGNWTTSTINVSHDGRATTSNELEQQTTYTTSSTIT
jgi:hypothetical protein